ncbi:short-chain dehydrogenase/reductase SDR [Prosthecochloris aestuarii DSM 271]|uniref:Short-chain dehydrogenase/reductase SDR n=1 Tax=Prosthecochloris aestuarii (strain DSM 271 / SK 413) TaxID=290512 RepID=B4S490_PROA2|nr:SDR family oxidoreductase [Prosthecochloris aestuarii]ACF45338.1 short-chain dehydrogenase/reductase SDR [Prosthecochloris aestuarii DSM 271]
MSYTLITGASTGIGKAFALEFARCGHNLVLVARTKGRLEELASEIRRCNPVNVRICIMDFSDPASAEQVYRFCRKHALEVDVLVNCAGFGYAGGFDSMPLSAIEEMMQVNMLALAKLTRLFVQHMVAGGVGSVINIASMGGFQGVAFIGLYAATKSFIITLGEALHEEFRDKGIRVVTVCPGYIKTDFHARSGQNPSLSMLPVYDTSVVVRASIKGLAKNRVLVFPTLLDFLLVFLQRFTPRQIVLKIAAFLAPL